MNAISSFPSSSLVSASLRKQAPQSKLKILSIYKIKPAVLTSSKPTKTHFDKLLSVLQYGAFLAAVEAPAALAVTGENNNEEDLLTTLLYGAIIAFGYLFIAPPIIMNWMRLRWYKRKFLEMYLQFMFTFIFFPGLLLWAPFINFRKLPRDPTMEFPWSTPKDDPNIPLYKDR
ncbi:NAD(P)H-quinone oxidoreductase subunit L [Rhynchospora pubera]|uniref:NAD(P)H-quinone oxidoreductase subunit L n=1 Tax=Rhynchospora pubera TaxID=906938 RepID=A0AAV8CZU5_9POAL|nr:NAD(P)H-quinone oxidoreductase subunit L [Rhynchospora pubera]